MLTFELIPEEIRGITVSYIISWWISKSVLFLFDANITGVGNLVLKLVETYY